MKILNLKVEGFRSLKSVDWSPGDLNVIIGPNAGGKSNLLQLLEMIAASARGKLSKFVKRQGGMEPLLWDGSAKSINITIKYKYIEDNEAIEDFLYNLEFNRLGITSSYQITKELFSKFHIQKVGRQTPPIKLLKRNANIPGIFDDSERIIAPEVSEHESFISCIKGKYIGDQLLDEYQNYLESWRIYSEFNTGMDAVIRQAVVTSYDKHIEPDGQNLVAVLHTLYEEDRDFKNEIDSAMRAAFGDDFEELSFPPAADGRTQLRIRWKSLTTGQSAANLSDGTLRFLYLLTILANPEPPALIAIDEPETGLHPSMLSIIAEYAAEAARRTQVIFTTHSAEMLNAFSETRPTVTVCEWHAGQTELHVLAGEKLDYWLGKYSLGELYRTGELENMK